VCIAIYKPAGAEVGRDVLRRCWDKNPDGAGFMYAKDGELVVEKGFMRWKMFKKHWNRLGDGRKELPMVIHFRIATEGSVSPPNCHPFRLQGTDIGFVHNGVISSVNIPDTSDLTDSEMFGRAYLEQLSAITEGGLTIDQLQEQWLKNMIDGVIGSSKLVFMDSSGKVAIVNKRLGEEAEGVWFSNTAFKSYSYSKTSHGKNYSAGGHTGGYHGRGTTWSLKDEEEWINGCAGLSSSIVDLRTGKSIPDSTSTGTDGDKSDAVVEDLAAGVEWWICRKCTLMFRGDKQRIWVKVGDSHYPECPECKSWIGVYDADDVTRPVDTREPGSDDDKTQDQVEKMMDTDVWECDDCDSKFFDSEIQTWDQGIVYCPLCGSINVHEKDGLIDYLDTEEDDDAVRDIIARYEQLN